ncbi:MAG: hypothetical protein WBW69_14915, partial [Candidatus Korobacteraceae bacterium]
MSTVQCYRVLLLCAVVATATLAHTQDKAFVEGDVDKVVNGQGVPVPGVVLQLQNNKLQPESQGILRSYTSDSDGLYRFFDLTPSDDYLLTATAPPPWKCWFPSFDQKEKYTAQKFTVNVGEKKYVLPPAICAEEAASPVASPKAPPSGGPAAPSFSADDSPPQASPSGGPAGPAPSGIAASRPITLDTLAMSLSTVITSDQLRTLPLYNRNFLALGFLSITTHDVQAGSTLAGASFSVSGQQPTANDFLLDGLNNVAAGNNQAIPFQVNDAIQEFRVVYDSPDAQFGDELGGVVNIVTQRGTSHFHGSLFGFFGSDALNANSPISDYANSGFAQAAAYAGPLNSAMAQAYTPFCTKANPSGCRRPLYAPTTYNQYVATVKALNAQNGTHYCTTPGAVFG